MTALAQQLADLIRRAATELPPDVADAIAVRTEALEDAIVQVEAIEDVIPQSEAIRDSLIPKMVELRVVCDKAETITAKKFWPYPTYGDLLFGV